MGNGVNIMVEESIPALDNGNGYSIPHVDENGNLTITNIDPDIPCGKLDGQTSEQVVNDWMDTNYPNTSQEELANMGINVSFNEGGEEYTLNGELVKEEEYNEANTGGNTQIFDNGNDSSLKNFVPSQSGYDGTWVIIGGSHKEPGKIEISIDIDKFNNTLNNWMNVTITKQQEETINKIMEDKFGVKDVVSAGLSVKKVYGKIKKVLEGKLGAEYSKSSIAAIGLSLLVDPAMDTLDWENLWDADDMLKIHGNNYVKSYYNYYANKGNRDTFVEELIIEDCVHTGEVDLWTGLQINNNNMTFLQHNIEWGDSYFSDPLSSESVQEAGKNWTNFMAENRINLSKELVRQIYSDIMVILGNYSNITEKINEKENEIVDLWEKAFSGNKE